MAGLRKGNKLQVPQSGIGTLAARYGNLPEGKIRQIRHVGDGLVELSRHDVLPPRPPPHCGGAGEGVKGVTWRLGKRACCKPALLYPCEKHRM